VACKACSKLKQQVLTRLRLARPKETSLMPVKPASTKPVSFNCSFCGLNEKLVKRMIAGPNVAICGDCVEFCVKLLKED